MAISFKKLVASVAKPTTKALGFVTASVQAPIKMTKAVISDVTKKGPTGKVTALVEKETSKPLKTQIGNIVLNTALAAGAVVGGASAAGAKIASKVLPVVGSAIVKHPIKSAAVGLVVAPAVYGAVKEDPIKVAEGVSKLPSSSANFGGNVMEFIKEPSMENLLDIPKENPVITALAAAPLAIPLLKSSVIPAALLLSGDDTKENILSSNIPEDKIILPKEKPIIPEDSKVSVPEDKPVLPETRIVQVGKTPSKKRKTYKKVMPSQKISQRVNVLVSNRNYSQNKRYINERMLCR